MKSPKGFRTYKSASEQQIQKPKPAASNLKFKSTEKLRNSKCFKSKFLDHKSETNIDNSLTPKENPFVNDDNSKSQLIPTPKTPKQPKETLRKCLTKLKSSQWNDYVFALREIVQISRFYPHLLAKSMPAIYKGITTLLKCLKKTAARTACQAANELFMNIQVEESSEFDDLVHTLLQKTADPNQQLQADALEALNSMVIHVPPSQSVKILLHRRIAGYDLSVRITASKLLACVLDDSDSHSAASLSEDMKCRLVFAAMRFLQDNCYDIKFHGMRLLTMMIRQKEFENVFQTKVSEDMLNQVNKIIENVKTAIIRSNMCS